MINWDQIDTVLLDMDGTLLDLHFDNHFWCELVPERYAQTHKTTMAEAIENTVGMFQRIRGTLEFYCTDFMAEELKLPIVPMKHEILHLIDFRPSAQAFLKKIREMGKHTVIITNAHRDSFDLKHEVTGLGDLVDKVISSHDYKEPKESPEFWRHLSKDLDFDPNRTLFVDDSEPVLKSGERAGIQYLLCIVQPDSQKPHRENLSFEAFNDFQELFSEPLINE